MVKQQTQQHPLRHEAMVAGALGAASVALWYLILDVAQGRLFFTPAALGSAFFQQARGVDQVQITAPIVLAYSLVHIALFLVVGFIAARLIFSADEEPRVWLGIGVALVTMEVFTILLLALTASWLLDALHLWTVLVANVIGAGVMGAYLWQRHPAARANLRADIEEIDVRGSRPPVRS